MKHLHRRALDIFVVVAMLAGCSGSQPPIGAPGAMPQRVSSATHADHGKSWMRPEATSGDLLYVSQLLNSGWNVIVLTYPQGQLVGTITNIDEPMDGLCSDPAGNVWVPAFGATYEFAHGGTSPIKTFSTPGFYAFACSVDSTTGNLAVLGLNGTSGASLAVWPSGGGSATYYPLFFFPVFAGYDNRGNLFIDGNTNKQPFIFVELPKGASQFQNLTLNIPVTYPGPVLWDGKYVTVGVYNEQASGNEQNVIYRVKVAGSKATVVGTSYFEGFEIYCCSYSFHGKGIIGVTSIAQQIGTWAYPRGGAPIQTISGFRPYGLTVSRGPHCGAFPLSLSKGQNDTQPPTGAPGAWQNLAATQRQSDVASRKKLPQYVYVANQVQSGSGWASSINIYPALATGNMCPNSVISGSQTQLTAVAGIVVDSAGEIYVANVDTDEIVGFAAGSDGNVSPNIVISGSQTELSRPTGLALDSHGNLYVANCASGCNVGSAPSALLEFSAGSNGNIAPVRNISGSATQISNANAPAVDASGNIYVANYISNTIDVFAPNASGNIRPIRVISGSRTLLNSPDGIAVDQLGLYAGSANDHFIERFRVGTNGNKPPAAVISGTKTQMLDLDGIAVDSHGAVYASSPGNQRILSFAALANGDAKPLTDIYGSNTGLVSPVWVYVR
jgi:hypothetical protein